MPWIAEADVVVANLEGPIGDAGAPRPNRGAILHNDPRVLPWFSPFRSTAFCLANNHIMDRGPEGLRSTLQRLDALGIARFGAGENEAEALRPLVIRSGAVSLGLMAFTTDEPHVGSVCALGNGPGAANLNSPAAFHAIAKLVSEVTHACVLIHWGHEFFEYPDPAQMTTVARIAALGVKLIVGHHPHVIQGITTTGNATVAYSLGNCIFPEFVQTNGRVRTQSKLERNFLLLRAGFTQAGVGSIDTLLGRSGQDGTLAPFDGGAVGRGSAYLAQLSRPLSHGDYPSFYAGYTARRTRTLERQQALRALRKALSLDPRTITLADVRRTWARLVK